MTRFVQEFSIPLILGVVVALIMGNMDPEIYSATGLINRDLVDWQIMGHPVTPMFLINDIFMVFFFGIAAKEITESILPGGDLNPPSKAINPLMGTIGGVVGPVAVYLILTQIFFSGHEHYDVVLNGWGVPTATDIALAWLVARIVFGTGHPAVNFLLLLAVADDAIGLGIIAIFYGDPAHPAAPEFLLYFTVPGMVFAYLLRKYKVQSWIPYVAIGGLLSWIGFIQAHLHPALALVPIIPFLPGPKRDTGLFVEEAGESNYEHDDHSPLHNFEHDLKLFVDMGLFFFGFANAGVEFDAINAVTWIILAALLVGKVVGITLFSWIAQKLGAPLPTGMRLKHLFVASIIAGLGLTVALFVAGQAFKGGDVANSYLGPAKMGAVFSAAAAFIAIFVGRLLKVEDGGGKSGS